MTDLLSKATCKSCGKIAYPPRGRCPSCGGSDLEASKLEGPATLLTFTRVHMLSLAYTERYITLGIVECADGTRALGRLFVDAPQIGMKLKAEIGTVKVDGLIEHKGLRLTAV